MATPSRVEREGAGCRLSGRRTLSKSIAQSQLLYEDNCPTIVVDRLTVRIIGGEGTADVPPRRQSFSWEANAAEYAARLSAERGWPIEAKDG